MPSEYTLELPNDLRVIERAVQYLMARGREQGFDARRLRFNFRVGVTEALANAMLYGNGRDPHKRVRLDARLGPDAIMVRVTDEGRGFDPRVIPDPRLPAHRVRTGGRGIFLIRRLMDRVEFNHRGNAITMVLLARRPRGTAWDPRGTVWDPRASGRDPRGSGRDSRGSGWDPRGNGREPRP